MSEKACQWTKIYEKNRFGHVQTLGVRGIFCYFKEEAL